MNRTPAKPGHEGKQLTIRDLFPDLSEEQLKEVEETFHGYLEVVWEIYEEVKRERPEAFDSTFVSSPGVRNGLFRRVGPEPACTTRIMGAGEAASSPKPRLCSRMQLDQLVGWREPLDSRGGPQIADMGLWTESATDGGCSAALADRPHRNILPSANVASLLSLYRGLNYGCIHLLVGVIDPNANLKFLFLVFCQQVVPLPGIAYDLGAKLIDSATCGQKSGFDSFHLIRTGPN